MALESDNICHLSPKWHQVIITPFYAIFYVRPMGLIYLNLSHAMTSQIVRRFIASNWGSLFMVIYHWSQGRPLRYTINLWHFNLLASIRTESSLRKIGFDPDEISFYKSIALQFCTSTLSMTQWNVHCNKLYNASPLPLEYRNPNCLNTL